MGFDDSTNNSLRGAPVIVPYMGSGMPSAFNILDTQIHQQEDLHASPIIIQPQHDILNDVEITWCNICNPCSLWNLIEQLCEMNITIWDGRWKNAYFGTRYYYNKGSLLSMLLSFLIESIIIFFLLIGLCVYYLSIGTAITVFGLLFIIINIFTLCIPAFLIWYCCFKEPQNEDYELLDTKL